MLKSWWGIHGQLLGSWWTGCWSAFGDEVHPGNLPCSLWGGSLILLVQEGKSHQLLSSEDIVWNGRHFVIFLHFSDSSAAWLGAVCDLESTFPLPA